VSAKSPEPPPNAESDVVVVTPKRQCGRCRKFFDGDPALHPIAIPEWWACPPCREVMFGDRQENRKS
jgi:hypothetical protein